MPKSLYDNTNVVSLTDDDFIISKDPKIRSSLWRQGDQGYLMASASWCPHCQSKVPMWTRLANEINTNPNTDFIIMSSDVEHEVPLLANESQISGVPTLFYVLSDGSMKKLSSRQPGSEPSALTTDWSEEDLRSRIAASKSKKASAGTRASQGQAQTQAQTQGKAVKSKAVPRGRNQKGGRLV